MTWRSTSSSGPSRSSRTRGRTGRASRSPAGSRRRSSRSRGGGRGAPQHLPELLGRDPVLPGDLHHVLVADELARMLPDHLDRGLGGPRPALGGGEVGRREHAIDPELEERHRGLHRRPRAASGSVDGQVGRIDPGGQVGDGDLEVVLLLPLVEALGGGLPGGVGVEGQHELAGVAPQQLDVLGGERRAARGDGGRQARPGRSR